MPILQLDDESLNMLLLLHAFAIKSTHTFQSPYEIQTLVCLNQWKMYRLEQHTQTFSYLFERRKTGPYSVVLERDLDIRFRRYIEKKGSRYTWTDLGELYTKKYPLTNIAESKTIDMLHYCDRQMQIDDSFQKTLDQLNKEMNIHQYQIGEILPIFEDF